MPTLFLLSSSKLLPTAIEHLGRPIGDIRLAHIITASKVARELDYMDRSYAILNATGVRYDDIDIEGKSEQELLTFLGDYDIVFVNGGNPFYLLKVVRETGFERVVKTLLDRGILYVGASAGSYIACPTIETTFWRAPGRSPHPTYGVTDITAMNLVPFIMKVHYTPDQAAFLRDKIQSATCPVKILTDDQGLLVQNGTVTLIGTGPEVIL